MGVKPKSAAISLDQRGVGHLLAEARKGEKALPEELVLDLVNQIASPKAVVWDGQGRRPALLFVLGSPVEAKLGRIVVRVNYLKQRESATNAIRSAGVVDPSNLRGPGMTLLEGMVE
ncbi:MAG: hypothetical protein ACOCVM_06825 [Desulfovibrionaceae bacterium]